MSQGFQDVTGVSKVKDGRARLLERDETLRSSFSGTAMPTTPAPVAGQVCWRTDLGGLCVYNGTDWRRVVLAGNAATSAIHVLGRQLEIDVPDGDGILFGRYGAPGAPRPVSPSFGYSGMSVSVHANPGTGLANAIVAAGSFEARLSAGTGLIACAGLFSVYNDGTWGPGGSPEAGGVAIFTQASSTRGGVVFGGGFHAGLSGTTGGSIRGIEVDTIAEVSAASKIGIELVSVNVDSGAISGTMTINGSGATIADCAAIRISTVGAGRGFDTAICTIKGTGGSQPVPAGGRLWRAGGFTTAFGLQWEDMTFSTAAISLGQATVRMASGNANGRVTSLYSGVHDDIYLSENYSFASSTVDNAALGTSAIRVRGVNGGRGAIDILTGAVNTAPSLIAAFQSGLVLGAATGGDKGVGTINVAGDIYKNNNAYTNPDYVFEHFYRGEIVTFAGNAGAETYSGLMPLDALRAFTRENLHLPQVPRDGGVGIFERADFALRAIEETTLHVLALHDRVRVLEDRVVH